MTIKGAKAGQQQAKQPNIAKDTASSVSTLKILYGLSEGEIEGLVNGGASIKLDETQIVNDNGTPNFVDDKGKLGISWDFRTGSNDQEHIAGFPFVENETPVGMELRSNNPYSRTFTEPQLSALRVRVFWNALKQQDTKGNVSGVVVKYAIDLQTDSGAFITVLDTEVNDKTSGKYERSHRIDLPRGKKWTIRVRRITPDSTSELVADKMYIDAITEVIDAKLRYPNTALLGLQYDAKTFSNVAKLAVRCRGRIIAVPTNYNPETRVYSGFWDGTFKFAYTNNPAWVFLDLCTHWRYGLGSRLDYSMIDRWSLYQLAQYCDQMVSDGKGGYEPRFTVNLYIQSQQDAFSVLQSLSSVFRAMSYWRGDQIVVDADMPSDPVYTFTRANVVDGEFNYAGTKSRDRHTVVKVAWDNPNNGFKTEYEWVRNESAVIKHGIKTLDLSLVGCTSQGQARRAGEWALQSERLETRTVSFKTGLEGFIPNVGDIISVSDEIFAGRANGGRILSVSNNARSVTLDRDAVVKMGDTLLINGNDGKTQKRQVSGVAGKIISVNNAFTDISPQNVWAIDSDDLKVMLFRVMSIHQIDEGQFEISGLQHEPKKFTAIDFNTVVQPNPFSKLVPKTIEAPTTINITQQDRIVQGQSVVTMTINWSQVMGAANYEVEWKKDNGNWTKLPKTSVNSIDMDGVYSGQYITRVKAINPFGIESNWTTSTLVDIVGKVGKPKKLASLIAEGQLFGMKLTWAFLEGSGDTNFTEIETAHYPDTNVSLLGRYAYPTNTAVLNGMQGNLTVYYRGRTVDKFGNKSDWTDWVSGTTSADADKVLELLNGQITESQLHKDLGAKIDLIAVNSQAIQLEADQRQQAIDALAIKTANELNAEIKNRQALINDLNTGLSEETRKRLEAETGLSANISSETTARTNADSALSGRIDSVTATADNNKALIVSEQKTRADNDSALSGRIETVLAKTENSLALINTETTARANADSALSSRIDTNKSVTDNKIALAQESINTVTNNQSVISSKLDGVYAQINPRMAGDDTKMAGDDSAYAGVWTEMTARIEGDSALAVKIDNVTTNWNENLAYVRTETKTQSDAISSLASKINVLSAAVGGNISLVMGNYYTSATTDQVIANRLEALKTQFIIPELNAKATVGSVTDVKTQIEQVAGQLNLTSSKLDGVYAQINPRMAGDDTKMAGDDSAYAGVWTEMTARIEGDSALAVKIESLQAKYNENSAAITTQEKLRVDATSSLASRIDTAQATANNAHSALQNESQARASADNALSSNISTLQTTVGQNTASIQSQQQSINGLYSQWSVRVDVNGRISGIGLASTGAFSQFAVRSDSFYIAPPSGESKGTAPFVVTTTDQNYAGTIVPAGTYIQSAFIHNASIDTLKIQGNAVSIPAVQFTPTRFDFFSIDTEEVINEIRMDAKGGAVSISFGFESLYAYVNKRGGDPRVILSIKRDNQTMRQLIYRPNGQDVNSQGRVIGEYISIGGVTLPTMLDIPPDGEHVYQITLASVGLNAGKSAADKANSPVMITARSLHLIGARR